MAIDYPVRGGGGGGGGSDDTDETDTTTENNGTDTETESETESRSVLDRARDTASDVRDQAEDAVGSTSPAETARSAIDRVDDAVSDDVPDSRPARARGEGVDIPGDDGVDEDAGRGDGGPRNPRVRARTGPQEDQLRAQAAQQSPFDEDEIRVTEDDGQIRATATEDAVESQIRQDVAEEEGVDADQVDVDRTDDGIEIDVEPDGPLENLEANIRGERTDREFLQMESRRAGRFAEDIGDIVRGDDPGAGRTFGGAATETGLATIEPAGAVLFADQAGREIQDRSSPFDPTGATALLTLDRDDLDTVEDAGRGFGQDLAEDPADATGRAAGFTAAVVAPGAPRAVQSTRSRTDLDLRVDEFRADEAGMVRLDMQQRRSTDSDAGQRTIERDSPEADPSDPTVAERVDQITERWGGEGTMQRSSRGLDEEIRVGPRSEGTRQRSPEDQLPPREEFPSDAAFQRELSRLRQREQPAADTGLTAEAATAGAIATPSAETTASVFRDADADSTFGPAAGVDSEPDADVGFDAGFDVDAGSVFGTDAAAAQEAGATGATTQQSMQQADQQTAQLMGRTRGRSRRSFFEDDDPDTGQRGGFGIDADDETFGTGFADPEDILGDSNQSL